MNEATAMENVVVVIEAGRIGHVRHAERVGQARCENQYDQRGGRHDPARQGPGGGLLMDGGVTAAYWHGDVAAVHKQATRELEQ